MHGSECLREWTRARGSQNPEVGPAAVEVVLKFFVVELGDGFLLVISRRKLHDTLHSVQCCDEGLQRGRSVLLGRGE